MLIAATAAAATVGVGFIIKVIAVSITGTTAAISGGVIAYKVGKDNGKKEAKKLQKLAETERELSENHETRANEALQLAADTAANTAEFTESTTRIYEILTASGAQLSEAGSNMERASQHLLAEIDSLAEANIPENISTQLKLIQEAINACQEDSQALRDCQTRILTTVTSLSSAAISTNQTNMRFQNIAARLESDLQHEPVADDAQAAQDLMLRMANTIKELRQEVARLSTNTHDETACSQSFAP